MTIESITIDCLKQLMAFKNGLHSTENVGWSRTDKDKVKECKYWLQAYLNGLKMIFKEGKEND